MRYVAFFLFMGGLLSCQSADNAKKSDPLLIEAANYHNQATDIQEVIEPQIEQIDSLKTVLLAQKSPTSQSRIATLDSLKAAFEDWEKNLIEVPGMPHNHTHEKGEHQHHNHADATFKDLPAEQMRDLQRETLNSIRQIQARLGTVKKPVN